MPRVRAPASRPTAGGDARAPLPPPPPKPLGRHPLSTAIPYPLACRYMPLPFSRTTRFWALGRGRRDDPAASSRPPYSSSRSTLCQGVPARGMAPPRSLPAAPSSSSPLLALLRVAVRCSHALIRACSTTFTLTRPPRAVAMVLSLFAAHASRLRARLGRRARVGPREEGDVQQPAAAHPATARSARAVRFLSLFLPADRRNTFKSSHQPLPLTASVTHFTAPYHGTYCTGPDGILKRIIISFRSRGAREHGAASSSGGGEGTQRCQGAYQVSRLEGRGACGEEGKKEGRQRETAMSTSMPALAPALRVPPPPHMACERSKLVSFMSLAVRSPGRALGRRSAA